MSWHSMEFNLRPFDPLNVDTTNLNRLSSGSGPDALPPNVLSGAPAGLTLLKSHVGI